MAATGVHCDEGWARYRYVCCVMEWLIVHNVKYKAEKIEASKFGDLYLLKLTAFTPKLERQEE